MSLAQALWWALINAEFRSYVFGPSHGSGLRDRLCSAWCRLRGHPPGVRWYNPHGLEPDMHCQGCGDDLG
jgi:hypothetical protein